MSGKGLLLLDGEIREISSGDHIQIPPGTRHSIKAMTDLRIIETQIGSEIMEEDIVRLTLIWEDALAHVRAVRDRDVPTGLDAS